MKCTATNTEECKRVKEVSLDKVKIYPCGIGMGVYLNLIFIQEADNPEAGNPRLDEETERGETDDEYVNEEEGYSTEGYVSWNIIVSILVLSASQFMNINDWLCIRIT